MRRSGARGSVILEFALGSTLLFSLLAGVFQFGFTFYQYNRLHSVVSAAALYGALRPYDSPNETVSAAFRDAVRNMAVYGSPDPERGAAAMIPGLTLEHVEVRAKFRNQVPEWVSVSVRGFSVGGLFKAHTFDNSPRVAFRYMGRFVGGS